MSFSIIENLFGTKGTRKDRKKNIFYVGKDENRVEVPELTEFNKVIKAQRNAEKKGKTAAKESALKKSNSSPEPEIIFSPGQNYKVIENYIPEDDEIKGESSRNTPEGTVALGLKKRSKTRKHNKKHKTHKNHKKSKNGNKKSKTYKRKHH